MTASFATLTRRALLAATFLGLLQHHGAAAQDPPRARRVDQRDVLFGREVRDPYRWMEQPSEELSRWVQGQDRFARDFAGAVPARAEFRDRIARASRVERFLPVAVVGDRYYVLQANGAFSRRSLVSIDANGQERILIGSGDVAEGHQLSAAAISPDGRWLAYGLTGRGGTAGGGGWSEIRFRDLRSGGENGDRLTGVLAGSRSSMAWLPDGSGLYYERYPVPDRANPNAPLGVERLFFHRPGTSQDQDRLILDPNDADQAMTTSVSADGRYLVVGIGTGGAVENRVLVGDAGAPGTPLISLIDSADAAYLFLGNSGDTLWFQTTSGAPNWRIVGIRASMPRERWIEAVAENEDSFEPTIGATMIGQRFIVGYRHNAWLRVSVFETSGRKAYDLTLPKIASIWSGFIGSQHGDDAMYVVTDFADPGSLYRLKVKTGTSQVIRRPALAYDPDQFVTRQVFYPSKDGTMIPMFISSKRSAADDGPVRSRPFIIYGYGAFSWAASPWFRPDLVGWMESGGAFAMPNIRGGGEFGEAWHEAAVRERKQVTIDDYLAASEWLIHQGYTTPSQLVANGGSASGAVVGAAVVQRPDLFAAVTLDYPALDMIRLDQFTGGRQWRPEFGSTEIREQFEALLAYSPYHNLRRGVCYPPTLVLPGELDPTTVPMHAYKFVAALQDAQGCGNPVLLRVSWGAGHSAGANLEDSIDNWADQLAFLARVLEPGERARRAGSR